MENKRLIISYLFFIMGLFLIIYSWIKSYPISITDYKDFTIRHVYPSFFMGLSISLASLFFIMLNTKKKINKIFCIFGFVFLFYSINFFYPLLPGPDSQYFRGLTKYFIENSSPNPNANEYFQWPGLFIFAKGLSLITQIKDINTLAVIIFLIVGFILSTSLYFIFKYQDKKNAPLMVVIYFFIMFYFINYQYAAQSLAIAILFGMIALTLNKEKDNRGWIILLFCLIVLTHAFMAVFFIFYLVGCFIFSKIFKNKETNKNVSLKLLIICSIIYLFYLSFVAVNLFNRLDDTLKSSGLIQKRISLSVFTGYINLAVHRPIAYNDYLVQKEVLNLSGVNISDLNISEEAKQYLANMGNLENIPAEFLSESISNKIIEDSDPNLRWIKADNYAQIISRTAVISLIVLLLIGFVILFFQKKIKIEILSIGFSGFLYMALGTLADLLGGRGLQLLTVPLVAGALFFLDNKRLRKVFFIYFIILLISFPLIIIHSNFDSQLYQEYHEKLAGDYFIDLINSIPDNEKTTGHLFMVGRHDIIYYAVGAIDTSKYSWKSNPSERYIHSFSYLRLNRFNYIFFNENFKKTLVNKFKIDNEELDNLQNYYDSNYSKVYSNKLTFFYNTF